MLRQNNNLRRAHVRMKLLADDLQLSKEKLQVQNRRCSTMPTMIR
jgi:hypothetical protein